jgi:antiviral helicase SKI2
MDGALVDKGESSGWRLAQYQAVSEKLKARLAKRGGAAAYGPSSSSTAGRAGGGATSSDRQAWLALMKVLKAQDLLPCIVFSFSKKKCEECAFKGLSSVDITTAREKSLIHIFFSNAVKRLTGSDRILPQIIRLEGLLKRGIGEYALIQ